jgi:hypothetical protein
VAGYPTPDFSVDRIGELLALTPPPGVDTVRSNI